MTWEEFVTWQAFLRRHPRGLQWDNWVQARLAQQLDLLLPRAKGQKPPKFKEFVWNPPEPLCVLRAEARARQLAAKKESGDE